MTRILGILFCLLLCACVTKQKPKQKGTRSVWRLTPKERSEAGWCFDENGWYQK